jgi:hypothetical protein
MSNRYYTSGWTEARRKALARDRVCQDCGRRSGLHVHHIEPVRAFDDPADAHYLENLVVLCESCHPKWEGADQAPNLLAPEFGLKRSWLVHDLSLGSVGSAMPAPTSYDVYQYYRARYAGRPTRCGYCFHGLEKTRGQMMRTGSLCGTCGRKPKFWANYEKLPPKSQLLSRLELVASALDQDGISVNERAMKAAFEKLWDKEEYFGEVHTTTHLSVRMGLRHCEQPVEDTFFEPVCPEPKPTTP